MIKRIMDLFTQPETGPDQSISPELAAAALLVEVMAADDEWLAAEESAVRQSLEKSLQLSAAESAELIDSAKQQHQEAHDYYEMTRQINDHYSPEQKYRLILAMWKVAWADGNLDRYEDNTIRKVAELLYVPHDQFIKAKLEAKPA
ncbi:MAG: TerB family tellurite resistance protein [Pseudomonadota bacterium]|nr:TerB family tellurite resistance protein [Pseudomonadota bacterium]